MSFPSCFVTGTDTDAGKTIVTASILRYLTSHGVSSAGLKPIASGFEVCDSESLKNQDIEAIKASSGVKLPADLINLYGFEPAIAPHIAAKEAGVVISPHQISVAVDEAKQLAECVIVEGVGGWRVPLQYCTEDCSVPCDKHTGSIASLAKTLDLPVILVVGLKLGCLNHALLTAQAVRDDGLNLVGWVANNVQADFDRKDENLSTLRSLMPAPMLFEVPFLKTSAELASFIPQSLGI